MNLKKMWKRFWTLNVHNHEGFTLVELIIVIAILAILSSVAVVGYSSYVTKANMQADRTLATEIGNALQLAYYDDYANAVNGGYVILSTNGVRATSGSFADNALAKAFGSDLSSLKLQYDGWTGGAGSLAQYYGASSYNGKINNLLGTVDNLTSQLAGVLADNPNVTGDTFDSYLEGLEDKGIYTNSNTAAANAAVTYVANTVDGLSPEAKQDIVNTLTKIGANCAPNAAGEAECRSYVMGAIVAITSQHTNSTLSSAALVYAYAEAFCIFMGDPDVAIALSLSDAGKQDVNKAAEDVALAFGKMIVAAKAKNPAKCMEYFGLTWGASGLEQDIAGKQCETDAWATISAMGSVNAVSDTLLENISSESCFTDAGNFVTTYLDATAKMQEGDVLILVDANGKILFDPIGVGN